MIFSTPDPKHLLNPTSKSGLFKSEIKLHRIFFFCGFYPLPGSSKRTCICCTEYGIKLDSTNLFLTIFAISLYQHHFEILFLKFPFHFKYFHGIHVVYILKIFWPLISKYFEIKCKPVSKNQNFLKKFLLLYIFNRSRETKLKNRDNLHLSCSHSAFIALLLSSLFSTKHLSKFKVRYIGTFYHPSGKW